MLHKFRSFLSTLGILFGVASFITMLSIGEGAKRQSMRQIESLGLSNIIIRRIDQAKEPSVGLSLQDAEHLAKNVPGLSAYSPVQEVRSEITATLKELNTEIIGVGREFEQVQNLQMNEGRFLCDLDVKQKQAVCVIGHELAAKLGSGGKVGKSVRLGNEQYRIVGILEGSGQAQDKAVSHRDLDTAMIIPLNIDRPKLQEVILKVKNRNHVEAIAKLSRHAIKRLHSGIDDTQFIIPQELLNQAKKTQETFNLVLGSIAAVSLLVGGIGILNVMLASVYERKSEIGVRRAVGASQKDILRQFLGETLALTTVGGILGLAAGALLSVLISQIAGWETVITLYSVLTSLLVSFSVGIFSGLYPAAKAAKMDPIAALRY